MSKNKKKRGLLAITLSRRTKILASVAAATVVVLGVAITVLVVLIQNTKPTDSTLLTAEEKRQATIKQAQDQAEIITEAQSAMERGDSDKVNAIYQAQLKETTDPTAKIKLLLDESRVYVYGGKYDKAIQVAKTAEPLSGDKYLVADWLSQTYYANKQYALAAQYYTLAGKSVASPNNTGGFTQAYYDQKAASMQSLVKAGK